MQSLLLRALPPSQGLPPLPGGTGRRPEGEAGGRPEGGASLGISPLNPPPFAAVYASACSHPLILLSPP